MSRPIKGRNVCCLPEVNIFGPLDGSCKDALTVIMTVDEYECIRLIDHEGLKQEECAERMNIARTTVQSIYETARKKIADAIVNGKIIQISGGRYILCNGLGRFCGQQNCGKRHGRGHPEFGPGRRD